MATALNHRISNIERCMRITEKAYDVGNKVTCESYYIAVCDLLQVLTQEHMLSSYRLDSYVAWCKEWGNNVRKLENTYVYKGF
jgi:hypothetical protein